MTNDYPFCAGVERLDLRWYLAHRQMERAGKGRGGNLLRFAHVKQAQIVATQKPFFKFDGLDLNNYRHWDAELLLLDFLFLLT